MKKLPLMFLLLLMTNLSWGQNSKIYRSCLVRSRDNNNQPIPFDVNEPLAALKMDTTISANNTLYQIRGKKITFYIFKGMKKPDESLLGNINWATAQKTDQYEANDIYVNDDQVGIMVLRRGDFEFNTKIDNKTSITRLVAILDIIPKDEYYYDFKAANTKNSKPCYYTDKGETFAPLEFQGASNITSLPAAVDCVAVEKYASIIKFQKKKNTNEWGMILNFTQKQATRIENDAYVYTFYKLKGLATTFRLLVKFDFGCDTGGTKKMISTGGVTYPPGSILRQPNGSDIGVNPPN